MYYSFATSIRSKLIFLYRLWNLKDDWQSRNCSKIRRWKLIYIYLYIQESVMEQWYTAGLDEKVFIGIFSKNMAAHMKMQWDETFLNFIILHLSRQKNIFSKVNLLLIGPPRILFCTPDGHRTSFGDERLNLKNIVKTIWLRLRRFLFFWTP